MAEIRNPLATFLANKLIDQVDAYYFPGGEAQLAQEIDEAITEYEEQGTEG